MRYANGVRWFIATFVLLGTEWRAQNYPWSGFDVSHHQSLNVRSFAHRTSAIALQRYSPFPNSKSTRGQFQQDFLGHAFVVTFGSRAIAAMIFLAARQHNKKAPDVRRGLF